MTTDIRPAKGKLGVLCVGLGAVSTTLITGTLMARKGSYFLIEDKDKRPVVVLDDVMSELDLEHRKRLIEFVKKFDQVFITATRLEVKGAAQYQIKKKEQKEVF